MLMYSKAPGGTQRPINIQCMQWLALTTAHWSYSPTAFPKIQSLALVAGLGQTWVQNVEHCWAIQSSRLTHHRVEQSPPSDTISPKSIPNSQKQKQLPNTQWVKYVYCPALLTLEVERTTRNHSTNTLWKTAFPKAFAILWPKFPKLVRRLFPKELLSASLFTSST